MCKLLEVLTRGGVKFREAGDETLALGHLK